MSWAFASVTDFIHMGGYAAYVGSAYGIVLAVLIINHYLARRRLRQLQRELKRVLLC